MGDNVPVRLRVLHVVRPSAGGMRRHVELLVPALAARGVGSAIAGPRPFGLPGCPDYPAAIGARLNPIGDARAALSVARAARGFGCDLLHGHGLRGALTAGSAAALLGRPFLFTAHNLAPSGVGVIASLAVRLLLHRACSVICVSSAAAESLRSWGISDDRSHIVPNGVPVPPPAPLVGRAERLAEAGLSAGGFGPLVVAVGRLAPEKGFDVLVRAMRPVRERIPGAWAVIVGEGPERAALERLVSELGVEGTVLLPGHLAQVNPVLWAADVVAVPSRSEGQGIVALEAMAAERAVVASSVGGLVETLSAGGAGVLVRPHDPEALAEGLVRVLQDEPGRRAMGAAGRLRVETTYTVDAMAAGVLRAYARCIGREP